MAKVYTGLLKKKARAPNSFTRHQSGGWGGGRKPGMPNHGVLAGTVRTYRWALASHAYGKRGKSRKRGDLAEGPKVKKGADARSPDLSRGRKIREGGVEGDGLIVQNAITLKSASRGRHQLRTGRKRGRPSKKGVSFALAVGMTIGVPVNHEQEKTEPDS